MDPLRAASKDNKTRNDNDTASNLESHREAITGNMVRVVCEGSSKLQGHTTTANQWLKWQMTFTTEEYGESHTPQHTV